LNKLRFISVAFLYRCLRRFVTVKLGTHYPCSRSVFTSRVVQCFFQHGHGFQKLRGRWTFT